MNKMVIIFRYMFNLFVKIVTYPFRIRKFKRWYILNCTKHTYVCVNGIGDIVWFMAFWKQYKKYNNVENYNILVLERFKDMFTLYEENNLLLDSEDYIPRILHLWKKDQLKKFPNLHVMAFPKPQKRKIEYIESEYRAKMGIMMDDCYRFGCFDLSYENNEKITLPNLFETDYPIKTKKNILIVPYTKSRINIPLEVWEEIVIFLKKDGYTVYTNIGTEKEKPVNGTIPLHVKIAELPSILLKYNFVSLCGRCGLADWLFVNECKEIILHSCKLHPSNRYEWLCSSVERKDSFKVMKQKCSLNIKNADDIWLYTDSLTYGYQQDILKKISDML